MGKIYEDMRKRNAEVENGNYFDDEKNYISFMDFIEILEIYSQDNRDVVCQFLDNDKGFSDLEVYILEPQLSDDGVNFLFNIYNHQDETSFNEEFIEDVSGGGRLLAYDRYYWRIENLLALDSIQRIDFTLVEFTECYAAMCVDPTVALKYKKENIELKELLNITQNGETGDSPSLIIKQLYEHLHQLEAVIKTELKRQSNVDDEDLNPKSAKAVTHLLNVLFNKANYDISNAHSGTVNTQIVEYSKTLKTKIDKKTVTRWIKEVQQLRINAEKE